MTLYVLKRIFKSPLVMTHRLFNLPKISEKQEAARFFRNKKLYIHRKSIIEL